MDFASDPPLRFVSQEGDSHYRLVADRQGQLILTFHSVHIWQRYEQQGARIELQGD